jgi:hypothetical protein
MKPLESLNNVEKAKLLHSLFPAEAAGILQFVSGMSQTIAGEQEHQRGSWNKNELFGFDFWLSLSEQAQKTITKYGRQLEKNSSLFADQLFDGYGAVYMVHCLIIYITTQKHANTKFTLAVDLLFNP